MDLVTHISGVAPTTSFSPGASTPAPFNVPHTGLVDGLGPGSASKNMAELYNRDLLWRRAMIATAGLTFDATNWVQEVAAVQAIAAAAAAAAIPAAAPLGQCRLSKSGANLLLSPYIGNQLTIAGVAQTIPDAGVTLAPTALAANTSYFIYAYMVGAVMTLEASATGHSTSTTAGNKGVEIKTGDNTRTLVGQARIITGIAWQDTAQQRFVASWFNRLPRQVQGAFTAQRSTSSGTVVELNTEIRIEFLIWADEIANVGPVGLFNESASTDVGFAAVGFDGTTAENTTGTSATGYGSISAPVFKLGLTEGYHYATMLAWVQTGGSSAVYLGTGSVFVKLTGRIG